LKSGFRLLSLPNLLSCLRLALGLVIPVLIIYAAKQSFPSQEWTFWSAFVLFVIGALSDFWDGWLARRRNEESPLGKVLDPAADKVLIMGAMTGFAVSGVYSYWLLVPIFAREIAVTFCRMVWLRKGVAIGAESAGKVKFCAQVISVLMSFLFFIFPGPVLYGLNHVFLVVAMVLTIWSGFTFFWNNQALLKEKEFSRSVTSLGVGTIGPFPGTNGTLLGMGLLPWIIHDPLLHFIVFLAFVLLGYLFIPRMGLKSNEDPLEVVIDEVCGILIAYLFVPFTWFTAVFGFILFRFFDVTKTFPISALEKLKGAHGILWDDIGAGVYTWLILKTLFN